MNSKTLYLNLLAVALLATAGTAQAARSMPFADAVHQQMREASASIEADMRANVMNQTRKLDVRGVQVGTIELVEGQAVEEKRQQTPLDTAALIELLHEQLALQALEVPSMFGVYRYLAHLPTGMTVVVAE